jgi:hypothetical protein
VDITESTVSSILKAQNTTHKGLNMNSNTNDLFALTDYDSDTSNTGDVSNLLAMNTQIPNNAGVALEMNALGLGGEVFGAVVRPSVVEVQVDLTDWSNAIR